MHRIFLTTCLLSFLCRYAPAASPPATVAGVAVMSRDATVGALPLSAGSTIYSGDLLRTGKTGHLQIQIGKLQLAFAPQSAARIYRSGERSFVELQTGSLAYSAKLLVEPLAVYAGDVRFLPSVSESAVGRIGFLSLCEVVANVSQGKLQVTSPQQSLLLAAREQYLSHTDVGVEYLEPPRTEINAPFPDWSDPQFHRYHNHVACDAAPPNGPARPNPYVKIAAGGGIAVVTTIIVREALESPDHP